MLKIQLRYMWQNIVLILIIIIGIVLYLYLGRRGYDGGTLSHKALLGGKDVVKDLKKHPRSKSELEIVTILEKLLGVKFPTVNPDWLSWKGRSLELDGYNEKLKLAIEFSGPQHTKWVSSAEPYEEYEERVAKDIAKREICKANGVNLIVVDYTIPRAYWTHYLKSRLYDYGYISDKPYEYLAEYIPQPYKQGVW
jgi:hypothetical protein